MSLIVLLSWLLSLKVYYIDNGCYAQIEVHNLLELPPSLVSVPSLALHCALDHVMPLNEEWSDQCLEFFARLFLGKVVTITIKVSQRNSYSQGHMISCDVTSHDLM